MEQYIPKAAVVAEIKERIETYNKGYANGDDRRADALEVLLHDINTLEVKEVEGIDLEKEVDTWRHNHFHGRRDKNAAGEYLERSSQLDIAKHFFELGMSVNNKAQKGEKV